MSGTPMGVTSPALRRAALAIQRIDSALEGLHRPSTAKLLRENRATIADLSKENRRLRSMIAFGERLG